MSVVARLTAIFDAETSRFEQGAARVRKGAKDTQGVFISLGDSIKQNLGFLSAGAILSSFKNTINKMDQMGKAAQRIGISTESLSKMAYVGELADVSMEDLEKSISKMQKSIVDTPKAFDALGLSAQDLVNLSPDEAFAQITEALMKIENPTLRAATAMDVFGKSGAQIINYAEGGTESISKLMEEAKRLGLVFNDEASAAAANLNDNLTRLKLAIQGVFIQASKTGVIDAMSVALTTLLEVIVAVTGAYGDLLRVFGAEFDAQDTLQNVIDETTKKIEQQQQILRSAESLNKYFDRSESIKKIKDEISRLNSVLETTKRTMDATKNPPKVKPVIEQVDLAERGKTSTVRKTTEAIKEQGAEVQKLDRGFNELGMTFSSAFEDAIVGGKEFGDVLRGLAQDILRISTRRLVTEPLTNSLGGVFGSLFQGSGGAPITGGVGPSTGGGLFDSIAGIFGFADGGIPPTNRMSLVGERGPELFVPSTRGTVVPNDMLGSGSQGNTYVIDARGTDSGVVRRLEQALFQLAGPGVVEQRVLDAQARGAL